MKKVLFSALCLCTGVFLFFCAAQETAAQSAQNNILIVYFSLYGNDTNTATDASSSASIVIQNNRRVGTTEFIADIIQSTVGGDKRQILVSEPYPPDFDSVVTQARQERSTGYKPRLTSKIQNIERYDTVFIGYPVWGTTTPAAVDAFLSEYNLSGKKVIPFCTHDGYGQGRSFTTVAGFCPKSTILPGIALEATEVLQARSTILAWLKGLNIAAIKPAEETPITITIANRRLSGTLNNSPEAKAFLAMLPQTVSMVRYGDREYYGGIQGSIKVQSKGKYNFFDGEITYCPANNTAAIFFAQTARPSLGMEVFSIGRVTDDVSVFYTMEDRVQIRFERKSNE